MTSSLCLCSTYADKLSPKVVQSLLDLLCSQLKNLLSQAGVNLLSAGKEQEDNKHEDNADTEKKDLRGDSLESIRLVNQQALLCIVTVDV